MVQAIKKFPYLLLVLCPLVFWGQATTGYHRVSQVLARAPQGVTAQVVPYATITVDLASSGASAVIYSDPGLSVQIPGAIVHADSNGNYSYYIPLNYMVTENISAPGQGSFVYPNIGSNAPSIGTSGPQYSILEYTAAGTGAAVGPSNVTSDSTGNNLNVPGTVSATTKFSGPGTGLTGTASSLSIGGNAATATSATTATNSNELLGSTWDAPPAIGGTTPNAGTFSTVASGKSVVASGPRIDISANAPAGATLCTGTSQPLSGFYASLSAAQVVYPFVTALTQTIDYAAIQKTLNLWLTPTNGITITAPSGSTCVLNHGLNLSFTQTAVMPKLLDGRGSQWNFSGVSGPDLSFNISNSILSNVYVQNIMVANLLVNDAGGASYVLEFDGRGNTYGFLAHMRTQDVQLGYTGTTSGVHIIGTFQDRFSKTYANNTATIAGSDGWKIESAGAGNQLTGDIALEDDEATDGDFGIYSTAEGEIKISGGTVFGTYEQAVFLSGTSGSTIHNLHAENTWLGNTAGTVRPAIECDGVCTVGGNAIVKGTSSSGITTAVKLFSSAVGNNSILATSSIAGSGIAQGYLQTGGSWSTSPTNGSITLIGINPTEVTDGSGACAPLNYCSNLHFEDGSGVTTPTVTANKVSSGGSTVLSSNQSTQQPVQTYAIPSGSGYFWWGPSSAANSIPELYSASSFGSGAWGINGLYLNVGILQEQTCTAQTGITPPNFAVPSGCVDTSYTVSTLQSCTTSIRGFKTVVTDATAPTYLGTLTGGGTVYTPVVCNGTAWVSY